MAKNSSYSVRRRPLFRYLSSLSWTRGLLTERTSVTTVSFLESLHSLREGSRETAPSTTKIYWSLNVHRVIHHPLSLPTQMPSLDAFLTIIFFLFPFIFTSRRWTILWSIGLSWLCYQDAQVSYHGRAEGEPLIVLKDRRDTIYSIAIVFFLEKLGSHVHLRRVLFGCTFSFFGSSSSFISLRRRE